MTHVLNIPTAAASPQAVAELVAVLRTKQQLRKAAALVDGQLVKVAVCPPDVPALVVICPARVAARVRRVLGQPLPTADGFRIAFTNQEVTTSEAYAPECAAKAVQALLNYAVATQKRMERELQLSDDRLASFTITAQTNRVAVGGGLVIV